MTSGRDSVGPCRLGRERRDLVRCQRVAHLIPQSTGIDFDLNQFLKSFNVRNQGLLSASTWLSRIMASSTSPNSAPDSTSTNQEFLHTVFLDSGLDLSMQCPSHNCLINQVFGEMRPQPCSLLRIAIFHVLRIFTVNVFELSLEVVEPTLQIKQVPGAQVFASAIDRGIFVLGDKSCEARVSFEMTRCSRHCLEVDV